MYSVNLDVHRRSFGYGVDRALDTAAGVGDAGRPCFERYQAEPVGIRRVLDQVFDPVEGIDRANLRTSARQQYE